MINIIIIGKYKSKYSDIPFNESHHTYKHTVCVGEEVEKWDPLCIVDGNVKWCNSLENNLAVLQEVKYNELLEKS